MGKVVIFCCSIKKEEDFGKFGNFIYKVLERQEISKYESENVSSIQTLDGMRSDDYCEYVWLNRDNLRPIKKPHAIYEMGESLQPKFMMLLSEKDLPEVVQYKNAMMLEIFFKEVDLYCLVEGAEDFYFKLSQYYSFCNKDVKIYNKIIYLTNKKSSPIEFKRLAMFGESNSSSFFSLMLINNESNLKLRESCLELLGENIIENLIKNDKKKVKEEIKWNVLEGPLKLWRDNVKILKTIDKDLIIDYLKDMDTVSFILVSYSLKNFADSKREINLNEFINYVELIKQYANACYQLLENIVFHSDSKWGILSIRVHTSRDEEIRKYIIEKYNLYIGDAAPYFEIEICDYNGRQNGLNISQNFYANLPDEEKKEFYNILPEDLFRSSLEGSKEMSSSWTSFYSKPENMGKHYGLRIFQRIVSENQGKFIATSHQAYVKGKGEEYRYKCEKAEQEKTFCMPGTSYHILLPLESLQNRIVEKDITHEYGDWLRVNGKQLIELMGKKIVVDNFREYLSQKEKNELIADLANRYICSYENIKEQVLFLDMNGFKSEVAEIWAKAVIFALIKMEKKKHVVLYDCSEEFINQLWIVFVELFRNSGMTELFHQTSVQIMLATKELEQIDFIPASMEETDNVNQYISRVKGIQCRFYAAERKHSYEVEKGKERYIPFEMIEIDGGKCFFETYVENILLENIQSEKLGCQIRNTHMRLGSTIHINNFYEAEILFGNKYFITRFAFMILKDCYHELQNEKKITLYGYASYSEALLVELCNVIKMLISNIDIDYIILEREEEKRGFSDSDKNVKNRKISEEQMLISHTDRIRYNRKFTNRMTREEYIKDRKFILVVPINSTLKTHERLISLLKEENEILKDRMDWIIRNYAVLLVGSKAKNNYWEEDDAEKRTVKSVVNITPNPRFMIRVNTDYQESLECKMCYPDNPIDELPLIEVNAASTIPNQAFGLLKDSEIRIKEKDIENIIDNEMRELTCLKEHLLYRHTVRNENHYLYYFSTDLLVQNEKDNIEKSLKEWRNNLVFKSNQYHIIVAPMHYTNSVFAELVNENVFAGMASILRIDFNKDYRSNVYVKYSNIRQYIKQLNDFDKNPEVKFYFVDDSIITGKTYWRAKSLIESLVESYSAEYQNIKINIFDKIFILLDRNSNDTKMQYISKVDKKIKDINQEYYTFKQLEISSIRAYGDSCVLCNLKKEADLLNNTASTKIVHRYWERSNEKFTLKYVEDALIEKNKQSDLQQEERAFRRMFCTHILKKVMGEMEHGNQSKNVMTIILNILCVDYMYRKEQSDKEAFEYFLSYIKVMSRPFLIFQKAIKEAVFDLLLLIIETILKDGEITKIAKKSRKKYLDTSKIQLNLEKLEKTILISLDDKQKMDLVMLLMKQLCELKSNYILRMENTNKLNSFIKRMSINGSEEENKKIKQDFAIRYVILVKRLTGVSSDTSKSLWFDRNMLENYDKYESEEDLLLELLLLENTRNFGDGIDKLYQRVKNGKAINLLEEYEKSLLTKNYYRWIYSSSLINEQFGEASEINDFKEYLKTSQALYYLFGGEVQKLISRVNALGVGKVWEQIWNRVGNMNNNSKSYCNDIVKLKGYYSELNDVFRKEILGYQYQNFKGLLELMQIYDSNTQTLDENGSRQIVACVAIKHMCDEFDSKDNSQKTWENIQILTRLLGESLEGVPVQLIMEVEGSSEYYKQVVLESLRNKIGASNYPMPELRIEKHYEILRDEDNSPGSLNVLEGEIRKYMNLEEVLNQLQKYGYAIHKKIFVWKLEKSGDIPIYLYAPFEKDIDNQMKLRIRNILMLSKELSKNVFGRKQLGYLQEIITAKKRLKIYHREKAFTHTSDNVQLEQYRNVLCGFNTNANLGEGDYDSSQFSILRFLADMNVSSVFRKSLYKEFYNISLKPSKMTWWDDKNILTPDKEFIINQDNNKLKIKIKNEGKILNDSPIGQEEELRLYDNAENEIILLLISLILNVVEKDEENYRGDFDENQSIEVYISKTQRQCLRIANKICENYAYSAVENAKECLQKEPSEEERGISFWSMQAYVRRLIATYSFSLIETITDEGSYLEVKDKIELLTSEEFAINVGVSEEGGEKYFWYEIPLLSCKYETL